MIGGNGDRSRGGFLIKQTPWLEIDGSTAEIISVLHITGEQRPLGLEIVAIPPKQRLELPGKLFASGKSTELLETVVIARM